MDTLEPAKISYTVGDYKYSRTTESGCLRNENMPVYDYKCQICSDKKTIRRSVKDRSDIECCGVPMERTFKSAPSTAIKPKHQAVGSTFKHYGIKDPITGE